MKARSLLLALILPLFPPTLGAADPRIVRLSSLDLANVTQGWGGARADQAVTGKPMTVAGKAYEHGVGTHANSLIRLELNGGTSRFTAFAGVDDNAGNAAAAIRFKVVGDGKTLWQSEVLHWKQPAQAADLEVAGMRLLILEADAAGAGIDFDHADWGMAALAVTGDAPRIIGAPAEPAVVLTPKPAKTPRINGPRIFGVHPGHPVLFSVAATGAEPLTYGARGLPAGLQIDPADGRITGRLDQAGRYPITLTVSNEFGMAAGLFTLVAGDTLALTPHMGWNSWYVWEGRVTDQNIRDAAEAMVASGMKAHGYSYVNIDDCWAVKPGSADPVLGGPTRDSEGRILSNKRFPDMKALTDFIHAKGLKAGIYTSPGPTTCGGHEGAYGHEQADARRFAEWGFDFLKYDWCSYGEKSPGRSVADFRKPYDQMGGILLTLDRDMILNLCQYGMGDVWHWGKQTGGHSWRTAGDLGGSFQGIPAALFRDGFDVYSRQELHRFAGPGGWNDPDYLLLGYLSNWKGGLARTPLTPNEQYSHVSLWALVAAPLIFSGDIMQLDEFTLGLLNNDDVIEVDQDILGRPGRRRAAADGLEVWARELADGSLAVSLFNRGEMPAAVTAHWADLGLTGAAVVRDLWRQQELGVFDGQFQTNVARHGVALLKVTPQVPR